MKLILFKYTCANCSKTFKAPQIPGEHYGEFLLRSLYGHMGYLMALDSLEFKAIKNSVKSNPRLAKFSDTDRAPILHEIFGGLCDPSPDGSEYKIGRFPQCPSCQSTDMSAWGEVYPYEMVEQDIDVITFNKWNSLSTEERTKIIDNLLERYFSSIDS